MAELFTKITAESAGASPYEFYSVTLDPGNTIVASTGIVYAGNYSYMMSFNGEAGSNFCFAEKRFTAETEVYLKTYFYMNDTVNVNTTIAGIYNTGSEIICYPSISDGSGAATFSRLYHTIDSGITYTSIVGSPTITRNTWHLLEIYYKAATGVGLNDGEAWIKFNGDELVHTTGLDNDTITANRIQIGNMSSNVPQVGSVLYFDEIEAHDEVLVFAWNTVYNGNGNTSGTVPSDPNLYAQGATVTVLGNTGSLKKTGYRFAGWNTQADGLGTTYQSESTFSMGTATVNLYAIWIIKNSIIIRNR